MNRSILSAASLAALFVVSPIPLKAQEANGLKVFLDCHGMWCEMDHIRREIPYVNWVRDREDADVHILATAQDTGGGREFIFNFIGLDLYDGRTDTLRFSTSRTDVRDEERDGQTLTLQMGLMRYVADTEVTRHLTIEYDAPVETEIRASPADDPWSYWIFSLGGNGSFDVESLERSYRFGGNLSANRTTEHWKVHIRARGHYSEDRFEYEEIEDSVAVYNNSTYNGRTRIIRKLGNHWGTGLRASVGKSIRYNQDLYGRFASGLEYSFFPYSESTRRSLTLLYTLGIAAFDYEKITIFDKRSEVLLQQELEVALDYVQPWGNIGADLETSSYLNDIDNHKVEVRMGLSLRVTRGLRFNWGGSVARIQDQIYLSGEGISQDEILLRRRARGTDFELGIGFGFSYTFGSIFNNAVNPAMDDFR